MPRPAPDEAEADPRPAAEAEPAPDVAATQKVRIQKVREMFITKIET